MSTIHTPEQPAPVAAAPRAGLLRSPAAKFFLVAFLSVLLLVPLIFVYVLKDEREARKSEVVATLARTWAGAQTVAGPVLLVPYTVRTETDMRSGSGPTTTLRHRTAVILPETLEVVGAVETERRRISIFDVPVYTAALSLNARFGALGPDLFPGDVQAIDWKAARLALALSDPAGIETATATAGGADLAFEPGFALPGSDRAGLSPGAGWDGTDASLAGLNAALAPAAPAIVAAQPPAPGLAVAVSLRLKGMARLAAVPAGRQSTIRLSGRWPDPGFASGMLPSERTVSADGFDAVWRVPHLARTMPASYVLEEAGSRPLTGTVVGVDLVDPVDVYALIDRALKYGLMFVGAVFGIVFVLEVLSPRRIHIVQYAIVGLILVFFYVLLLAFAERIGFGLAYLVASLATGGVVSVFVGLQLASRTRALVSALAFTGLFALDYVILRLEDVALIAGAVTGFVLLTAVLFGTRRVDWSGSAAMPIRPATTAAPGT